MRARLLVVSGQRREASVITAPVEAVVQAAPVLVHDQGGHDQGEQQAAQQRPGDADPAAVGPADAADPGDVHAGGLGEEAEEEAVLQRSAPAPGASRRAAGRRRSSTTSRQSTQSITSAPNRRPRLGGAKDGSAAGGTGGAAYGLVTTVKGSQAGAGSRFATDRGIGPTTPISYQPPQRVSSDEVPRGTERRR